MHNHIIKICGISDPNMATKAARAGANLIGIVFHPASKRYVNDLNLDEAILIANAVMKAGAFPVAVFVNHTEVEMRRICEKTNIQIVQLHGEIARTHHHLLPDHYQRIYVKTLSALGKLKKDEGFQYLQPKRDLILIDHPNPGHGNRINSCGFHYDLPFQWLLAGGLSSNTVSDAINQFKPDGVDVSSGVESSRGNKDIFLIQEFIQSVRGHHDK